MTETSARPIIDYDHSSHAHAPHATEEERALRESCPAAWSESSGGFWVLSTYELVTKALRDHETFSSAKYVDENGEPRNGVTIPTSQGFRIVPTETDPPEWNGYRRILNPVFAPAAVEKLEPLIHSITTVVINRVIESGEVDLVLDVVDPITVLIALHILGLPLEDWHAVASPIHEITYSPVGSPGFDRAVEGIADVLRRFRRAVDEHLCQGHTLCQIAAPEVLKLRLDDGHAYVENDEVPEGMEDALRMAVTSCPESTFHSSTDGASGAGE